MAQQSRKNARLQAFAGLAREATADARTKKPFLHKVKKAGATIATFGVVEGVLQIPIITEFVATVVVPLVPEMLALGEEALAAYGAYRAARWVGRKIDEAYERRHNNTTGLEPASAYTEPGRPTTDSKPPTLPPPQARR